MTGRSTRRLPAVLYFFFLSSYFLCLCFDVTANIYRLIDHYIGGITPKHVASGGSIAAAWRLDNAAATSVVAVASRWRHCV